MVIGGLVRAYGCFPFFGGGDVFLGAKVEARKNLIAIGAVGRGIRNDTREQKARRELGAVKFEELRECHSLFAPFGAVPASVLQRCRDVKGAPGAIGVVEETCGGEGTRVPGSSRDDTLEKAFLAASNGASSKEGSGGVLVEMLSSFGFLASDSYRGRSSLLGGTATGVAKMLDGALDERKRGKVGP